MSEGKKQTKDPMSPEKIKEPEPTAVKREMTEEIVSPGEEVNPEEAREKEKFPMCQRQ
jgi:hypothetical protein